MVASTGHAMRYLIISVLAFMLALPVAAQDYQKGLEAARRGDYATALREWRPLAEQGHAQAQSDLGLMCLTSARMGRTEGFS